jgi:hypothetical protein
VGAPPGSSDPSIHLATSPSARTRPLGGSAVPGAVPLMSSAHEAGGSLRPAHRSCGLDWTVREPPCPRPARPACLRLASKLVRRQFLKLDPTAQDVTDDAHLLWTRGP